MVKTNIIRPKITVLDDTQRNKIHTDSLQILSSVGVRVDSEEARRIFKKAIGSKAISNDCVRIPSELVENALKAAPSSISIYNRKGAFAFHLPDETRFGIGVTALNYQDPETDKIVPFTRRHMEITVRLGEALPSFDVISTIGIIQDVPGEVSDLYAALEMTSNTVKPLVILVSDELAFPYVLDLLEHLHGDLKTKPFIIPYFNPITPLVINQGTVDKMLVTIERGLPFIFSNLGMAGATTPITPAGSLSLLNAELLAGLTLSQLIKEGTPIILGSLPAFFDMKVMENFYDSKSYLISLACAEMMSYYHLPHCGTSGSGMGWGPDLITGGHQWFNHLISCMGTAGLAPFVGDILGGIAFSPAIPVYANEVIEQARLFAKGFDLDDAAAAMDEIAQIGPGGHFLTSDQTLKHFRQAYYQSDIFPQLTFEEWQDRGFPQVDNLLKRHTCKLINSLHKPDDHEDLMAKGEAFVNKFLAKKKRIL